MTPAGADPTRGRPRDGSQMRRPSAKAVISVVAATAAALAVAGNAGAGSSDRAAVSKHKPSGWDAARAAVARAVANGATAQPTKNHKAAPRAQSRAAASPSWSVVLDGL